MKNHFNRVLSSVAALSLVAVTVVPGLAGAANGYSIQGATSVTGTVVTLSGTATANPYTGKSSDQNIAVDWTGACASASKTVFAFDSITFVGGNGQDQNGGSFTGATWSVSHDFSVAGTYPVCVKVYHANFNGAEGSDVATFSASIVIPPPVANFTLTYVAGANGTLTGSTTQVVASGANGTAVTAVANSGFHFVDWSDASTANPRTDTNVTANHTFTANFAANAPTMHTVTYVAGANGTLTGSTTQAIADGTDGTAVTAVANSGFHFVDWSDASTANPRTDTNVTADHTFTANFAANPIGTHTLTYLANAGGTVTGSTTQIVLNAGNGTAVTAVADSGFHFVSWSDGALTATRTDMNVTADASYTATFAANPVVNFSLTYVAGANGTLTGSTTQVVASGANGTAVTAVANSGFHFVDWSDASTANPRTDTNVTANHTFTANFAANTNSSGGSHHHSSSRSGGSSTGEVLGASCGLYMDKFLKIGSPKNDAAQVTKLQSFLTKSGFGSFGSTGIFGTSTEAAVKAFQVKYTADILTPWKITKPTGLVYITTLRTINLIECPELMLATPALIPWSQNPAAQ